MSLQLRPQAEVYKGLRGLVFRELKVFSACSSVSV